MDFDQAEKRFRRIGELRSTGRIGEQEYRDRVNALRVTDERGQVWMPQERTGQWYVYYGNQWMPATPPGRQPTAIPPSAVTGASGHAPASQGQGGGKMGRWIGVWAVVWIIIAVVVYILAAKDEPQALLGVAAAAVLSLVLMLANLNSQWSGEVADIRAERVRVSDDDGWHYQTVTNAYVRQANGKVKKLRAMPGWQVGDRLEKRKGDASIRKL
jgi:hypothetical protein